MQVLNYKGDVTKAENAQIGTILGHDAEYHPYEVIDVHYDEKADATQVALKHATPEALKAFMMKQQEAQNA